MNLKGKSYLRAFVDGMARIGGGFFSHRTAFNYEEQFGTDGECLASDWKVVGDDIRRAMKQFEKETKKTK